MVPFSELKSGADRKALLDELYVKVHELSGLPLTEIRARVERLPGWLRGEKGASPLY